MSIITNGYKTASTASVIGPAIAIQNTTNSNQAGSARTSGIFAKAPGTVLVAVVALKSISSPNFSPHHALKRNSSFFKHLTSF